VSVEVNDLNFVLRIMSATVSILSDKREKDVTVNKVTRPAPKLVCVVVAMGDNDGRSQRKTTKAEHDY